MLVRAECVRKNVVRALADAVATKLGIILSFFLFLFFFFFLSLTFLECVHTNIGGQQAECVRYW